MSDEGIPGNPWDEVEPGDGPQAVARALAELAFAAALPPAAVRFDAEAHASNTHEGNLHDAEEGRAQAR